MKRQYLFVLILIILILIIVLLNSLFFKKENFKTFIKIKKQNDLYFVDLQVGENLYKNLLIDTGSSYLILKGYKPTEKSVALSNKKYDIYTLYGGKKMTLDECFEKSSDIDQDSLESCGVHKLYNDTVYGNTVTVCDVVHGSAYNILGMTCLSPTEKTDIVNISFINWNNSIENFTIDFKQDIMVFNDRDKNFKFAKRHPIDGYFTDFYTVKDYSPQLGEIIIAFDTGATSTFVPKNIAKDKPKSFDITGFNVHISSYNVLDFDSNFIILGIDSMTKYSKFYFSKDLIGWK